MKKVIDVSNIEKIYQLREDQRGTFHDVLFDIIDEKGLSNKEVYTRCNIERKQFSKMQCSPNMKPSKNMFLLYASGWGFLWRSPSICWDELTMLLILMMPETNTSKDL
ncbi:hypothetical protein [[Clostridium] aminophilum]|uniref:hypothetical protein n=1 Tax=[Clostridium] aminophilum TaxID=1526 RepID=UPI00332BBBCB